MRVEDGRERPRRDGEDRVVRGGGSRGDARGRGEPRDGRDGDERAVEQKPLGGDRSRGRRLRGLGARTRGVLYLVDLAGSERLARSEARGERLKESQHINKSLSALGDVIGALQANSPHVPYRNSKLTMLLQGALGPSGKALCFVHVSPTEASAGETVSTLNFATRVASVELGRARKTQTSGGSWRPRDDARNSRRRR